jgi:rfaE bifunctional protein nucleotidyltransferase chain/domain
VTTFLDEMFAYVGLDDEDRSAEDDAFAMVERVRRAGGRVVATGGCFDLLHRGHVTLLTQARALGDALVVCLNSDDSVRRAKGDGRPLVTQEDRARVLSALECVDGVVVFDEATPTELLARLRPDVWVKGSDYSHQEMPEAEVVRRAGGRIVLLPVVDGYSTTRLVGLSRRASSPRTDTLTQEVS